MFTTSLVSHHIWNPKCTVCPMVNKCKSDSWISGMVGWTLIKTVVLNKILSEFSLTPMLTTLCVLSNTKWEFNVWLIANNTYLSKSVIAARSSPFTCLWAQLVSDHLAVMSSFFHFLITVPVLAPGPILITNLVSWSCLKFKTCLATPLHGPSHRAL